MNLLPVDVIRKKRFGGEHDAAEIQAFVRAYRDGAVADEQMSAWMMAVCFNGMTAAETAALTLAMRDSGAVLDLSSLGVTVDKHSTGGVGDKTSLILAPLVAAAGGKVPMMAGRGLGHTGGTLDKLESLTGFNVNLDLESFAAQVARVGAAIIGQTPEVCPADRRMYALRDVTGTVDSLPLICGSIMSKKLAEGMSSLVLDVKFGSGAFMKTEADAERLARALKDIGERAGKRVTAVITSMQQPLGRFVGNALEVRECLDILRGRPAPAGGKDYADTLTLTLDLAGHMLALGGCASDVAAGREIARARLADGSAYAKFAEICRAQGADVEAPLPTAALQHDVLADQDGFVDFNDLERFGQAGVHLGAGRRVQGDRLDFATGLEVLVSQAQRVRHGEALVRVHYARPETLAPALESLGRGLRLTATPVPALPLVTKILN